MRIVLAIIWIFCLISISQCDPKRNLSCLTGHKLLTRNLFGTQQNQTTYKLQYACLCPNNYAGEQCQTHLGIDCYMNPLNQLQQINETNVKEQLQYELEFGVDCYVVDRSSSKLKNIQLRQFLSKNNEANAFGVRQQFAGNTQVIWANDTQLFDIEGKLVAEKHQPLTEEERRTIIIGDNQQLYDKPFTYRQNFLGYGLINGNVSFVVDIINPEYGVKNLAKFELNEVQVKGVQEYIKSYVGVEQMRERGQNIISDIREMIRNGTVNDTVQKYINGSQRPKDINNIFNRSDPRVNPQLQQKPLPTIKLPIKLNPYNSTFYQSIRIQVSMKQSYQEIVVHQASLNSAQWVIPVKVSGLGMPEPLSKNLIVTDSSNKSYYRILFVVVIAGMVYLVLTYGYKRYKRWKNKQYTQFEDDGVANSL